MNPVEVCWTDEGYGAPLLQGDVERAGTEEEAEMDLTSVYKYLKEGYQEGRAGSFQWCPEPGQEVVVTDYTPTLFHVFSSLWAFFISFCTTGCG